DGVLWHGQDTQFVNVHVQAAQAATSGGSCWHVANGNNCRWIGCRGDQSNDSGWTIDSNPGGTPNSPGSSITLIGCGTENNANYGLNLINSSASGGQMRTPCRAFGSSSDFDRRAPATTRRRVHAARNNTARPLRVGVA